VDKKAKDLDYYLSLKYDIIIREIDDPDGAFFQASTEELDPIAFYGVGETPEQAIECFKDTQKALFIDHLENGLPIPEPAPKVDDFYSGKFIVRTSPATHRRLVRMAKRNKLSLNSQINIILSEYSTHGDMLEIMRQSVEDMVTKQAKWNSQYLRPMIETTRRSGAKNSQVEAA